MNREDKVRQAHSLIIDFYGSVLEKMSAKWGEKNLSLPQIRLLFVLKRMGTATVGEIAEKLHIGQSAASLLVDGLVKKGLIQRADDPEDRRKAIVRMTPDGEDLSGKRQGKKKRWLDWLGTMDEQKLDAAIETLQGILRIMAGGIPPNAEEKR